MNKILIEKLKKGEVVTSRRKGNSMTPIIHSGDLLEISPIELEDVKKGDVVFCRVRKSVFCHLVTAVDEIKLRFQIGNNHGHVNGWTKAIYGKITKVNDRELK